MNITLSLPLKETLYLIVIKPFHLLFYLPSNLIQPLTHFLSLNLPIPDILVNRIIQNMVFCVWFFLPGERLSGFIHVVACSSYSPGSIFYCCWLILHWMDMPCFTYQLFPLFVVSAVITCEQGLYGYRFSFLSYLLLENKISKCFLPFCGLSKRLS